MKNASLPEMRWMLSLVCCGLLSTVLFGAEEKKQESPSDEKSAETKVAGVIEAITRGELKVDNEHLTALEIKRLLPHGAKVKKGQNVVWFDTEEADKKIEQAEIDLKLAKLTLESEEFGHQQFLKTQALDKHAAQQARKQAKQKFDNFVGVDRDREILSAQFSLKSSQSSLDNAMEELQQLEQMYKEDDLTEESEEIVLKRAKQSVEFAQFRLDGTKITSERAISQSVPRKEVAEETSLERAELTFQKAIKDLETARAKQEIEMERKRDKFKEQQEELAEMRTERKQMVLQAPNAGLVLHGKLTRGKLSDKASTLKAGSKVTMDQVIATVVDPAGLRIRVDLDEKHLTVVRPGAKCKVVVRAFADRELNGIVKTVSAVPYAGSKYDCVVSFRPGKEPLALLPTMGCDLEFAAKEAGAKKDEQKTEEAAGKKKPAKKAAK